MLDELDLSQRLYLLQDRDGEFVERVESTGNETVKLRFHFTSNEREARQFSFNDLFSPLAVTSVGGEFVRGYAGRLVRVR